MDHFFGDVSSFEIYWVHDLLGTHLWVSYFSLWVVLHSVSAKIIQSTGKIYGQQNFVEVKLIKMPET